MARGALDFLPLWGVFAATTVLILLALQAGFWLGSRKRRRSEEVQKAGVPAGEIVAALLGLLALLLAFTFGLAAQRFDTRRGLVVDEANAIGTTWLRAGLLPEVHRNAVRKLLREYLEHRLSIVQSGKVEEGLAHNDELQGLLWAEAEAVGQKEPGSIVIGLFISSLNEVIDLHAKRVMYGLRTRIPPNIWVLLYFVALLAIGTIGHHAGMVGTRGTLMLFPLVLSFSAVMWLIARPRPPAGRTAQSQPTILDRSERKTYGNSDSSKTIVGNPFGSICLTPT